MATITIKIEKSCGYSGNRAGKSYIAKITGTSDTYIFAREFVQTEAVDRAEMFAARRKRRGTWIEAAALDPGLYEISRCGERSYIVVFCGADGACKHSTTDADRATRLALMLDNGDDFETARQATKPPRRETPATV